MGEFIKHLNIGATINPKEIKTLYEVAEHTRKAAMHLEIVEFNNRKFRCLMDIHKGSSLKDITLMVMNASGGWEYVADASNFGITDLSYRLCKDKDNIDYVWKALQYQFRKFIILVYEK